MRSRARLRFRFDCKRRPGDGVQRGAVAGVDWPEPCPCEARTGFTQYQLARLLDDDSRAIERVAGLRAGGDVSARIFDKLAELFAFPSGSVET